MRNIILIVLISISSCQVPERDKKPHIDEEQSAVTMRLTDLNGKPISLDEFNGKTVFINFWATWCKPCIQEMPSIESAQKIFNSNEVVFLLASNESSDEINAFKQAHQFDLKFIRLTNIEELNIEALPTTYIYNPRGEKVFAEAGYRKWDDASNIELIRTINSQK